MENDNIWLRIQSTLRDRHFAAESYKLNPISGLLGKLDDNIYPQAPEVQRGLLDVYGQLSDDYMMQSGPHMRVTGRALKRLLGLNPPSAAVAEEESVVFV